MKRQHGFVNILGLSAALVLCLITGTAAADDIAWDMVGSSSRNLVSYETDAPVFSSPGDGFQKYTVGVSESIPYALVDDSADVYPPDVLGVIDSSSDFDEFFGIVDTVNDDNSAPVSATWVFGIGTAAENLALHVDLAAMGDFEPDDSYVWTYQVDAGPVTTFLTAAADEDGTMTYTMASGTLVDLDDPLKVNGLTMDNNFQTFSTDITPGSQLTVVLTATTDGGSEAYVVRNILVTDYVGPIEGGEPIPTLSGMGIAAMVLLLLAGGVFLVRRLN